MIILLLIVECFTQLTCCNGYITSPTYRETHEKGINALLSIIKIPTASQPNTDKYREFHLCNIFGVKHIFNIIF